MWSCGFLVLRCFGIKVQMSLGWFRRFNGFRGLGRCGPVASCVFLVLRYFGIRGYYGLGGLGVWGDMSFRFFGLMVLRFRGVQGGLEGLVGLEVLGDMVLCVLWFFGLAVFWYSGILWFRRFRGLGRYVFSVFRPYGIKVQSSLEGLMGLEVLGDMVMCVLWFFGLAVFWYSGILWFRRFRGLGRYVFSVFRPYGIKVQRSLGWFRRFSWFRGFGRYGPVRPVVLRSCGILVFGYSMVQEV